MAKKEKAAVKTRIYLVCEGEDSKRLVRAKSQGAAKAYVTRDIAISVATADELVLLASQSTKVEDASEVEPEPAGS